jgi:hypothetical protein
MKLVVLVLVAMVVLSGVCLAGFFDSAADTVNEKVDQQTDKLMAKVVAGLDKGFDWTVKKVLGFIYWVMQVISIVAIGWLLSMLCDKDSRKCVRILVVLVSISLTVDKLKSLIN